MCSVKYLGRKRLSKQQTATTFEESWQPTLEAYQKSSLIKLDLVMWTFNGEKTLSDVLSRINKVIPRENVNQRFIVDDGSTDNTVKIAKKFGWNVLSNEGKGISDGANTAFKHVETDYFCSFEQDVLLPPDWWTKISNLIIGKKDIAAACGLCFVPKNNFCFGIEQYSFSRRNVDFHGGFGKTLGATIWDSKILMKLGGFPKLKFAGQDTLLLTMIDFYGYSWRVAYDTHCLHLHSGGLKGEFKRHFFYGESIPQTTNRAVKLFSFYKKEKLVTFFKRFIKSPISSVRIVMKTHDPRVMISYPVTRLGWLLGYIKGRKEVNVSYDC